MPTRIGATVNGRGIVTIRFSWHQPRKRFDHVVLQSIAAFVDLDRRGRVLRKNRDQSIANATCGNHTPNALGNVDTFDRVLARKLEDFGDVSH